MSKMHITTVEKADNRYHTSPIIIHDGWRWHFAKFQTMEQLNRFLDYAGLEITLEEEKPYVFNPDCGTWRRYSVNRELDNSYGGGFWNLSEVPEGAKKIKGHSNGSIVDCYILNDGETLHVYRPNPNAKDVYKPLPLDEHIKYMRENGGI